MASSSSCGDEEFDSRGDQSFSSFLNSSTPSNPSPLFDPLSTYFDIFTQSSNPPTVPSQPNLDMVLSRDFASHSSTPADQLPPFPNPSTMLSSSGQRNSAANAADQGNAVVHNPRKRSRASRRAPTTVLTTDTSNFRAMVQEFTGIPPPPFLASSFPTSRLNLFGTSSTRRSPLRPFQVSGTSNTTTATATSTTGTTTRAGIGIGNIYNSTSDGYRLSDLGLPKQPQMQYPPFTFQAHQDQPQPQTSSATESLLLAELNRNFAQRNTSDHLGNAVESFTEKWDVIEKRR